MPFSFNGKIEFKKKGINTLVDSSICLNKENIKTNNVVFKDI